MPSSKLTASSSSSSRNSDANRRSSAKSPSIIHIHARPTPTNSRNRGSRDRFRSKNRSNSSSSMNVDGLIRNVYDESPSAGNALLDAEITLIDPSSVSLASGIVIDPVSDCPPLLPPLRQESFSSSASQSKTVDDVWKDIVAGRIVQREYKEEEEEAAPEMMTLEDFLAKASAAEEEEGGGGGGGGVVEDVKMSLSEGLGGGIFSFDQVSQSPYQPSLQAQGSGSMIAFGDGNGSGVDANEGGRGKWRALLEPMDKAAQQRQRRMIKNRESAARSRERKQLYQAELESLASKLEQENEQLLREKGEHNKARFKLLMERLVPVVERRKPARPLRRVRSMQWTRKAFNICNFTQATPLVKPNSTTFTWNTSRPGFFYFSFTNNASPKPCRQGQKLAIMVSPAASNGNVAPTPSISVEVPAPASGGRVVSPSPAYPSPFGPRGKAWRPASPPEHISGGALPFINSNPADPLPTGEVDSATIRPLPSSGSGPLVARFLSVQMLLCRVFFLLV